MESNIAKLSTRDVLQNASIGTGGLTVNGGSINITGGGALTVSGTATFSGSLTVPAGSLNTGGAITAGTSVTAGTSLNGQSLALSGGSGAVTGVSSLAATGALSGASLAASGAVTAGSLSSVGGVAVGGAVTGATTIAASGAVSGTTGTFNSGIYSTDARNFTVVTGYASSWIDSSGHLGISASTERFKKDIAPWAGIDPEVVLSILPMQYRLAIPDRIVPVVDESTGVQALDPETGLPVTRIIAGFEEAETDALHVGFIAERLVEAGIPQTVVYDSDGLPVSLNYSEWVIPQQVALRYLRGLVTAQQVQIDALSLRLTNAGIV
ncbi:hypothetical protein RCH22_000939 [Cryobacterium psychrotolerans]|nr:hypothetical protein [Cryobacterium psychrotolerans]MEC5149217.1 hypothetical protein [Cryobacterium psychrotolerans]MEC5149298.1 hypothetical protein [Cryobacterium psychrotolerans]